MASKKTLANRKSPRKPQNFYRNDTFSDFDDDDDEEDEFILKIKAAAANKAQAPKTATLKDLIPSILNEDNSPKSSKTDEKTGTGKTKGENSFFAHALDAISKEEKRALEKKKKDEALIETAAKTEEAEKSGDDAVKVEDDEEEEGSENDETADQSDSQHSEDTVEILDDNDESETSSARVQNENSALQFTILNEDVSPTDVVTVEPEQTVSIYVKVNEKLEKFVLNKNDKLEIVFQALSQLLHLSVNEFSLLRNGLIDLRPSDTPNELGLEKFELLECAHHHKAAEAVGSAANTIPNKRKKADDENVMTLKFQNGNLRCVVELVVNKLDSFEVIKNMYNKERGLDANAANKSKFIFDGEELSNSDTPRGLDMDDGDCIDVI